MEQGSALDIIAGVMDPKHKICARCGYDLVTTATSGTCPECGAPWDLFTGRGLRKPATEKHRRGDRLVARLRTITIAAAAVMALSCGGVFTALSQAGGQLSWRGLAIGGLVAAVLTLAAISSYVYEDEA